MLISCHEECRISLALARRLADASASELKDRLQGGATAVLARSQNEQVASGLLLSTKLLSISYSLKTQHSVLSYMKSTQILTTRNFS
ncbi:MAG: hypothetical protein V7L20_13810 [Nostoc sp.]|uniref:hypothetical protein n=1 Tax=Nostoc sp. TaxID=1180 RepID=UPI002FFC95A5